MSIVKIGFVLYNKKYINIDLRKGKRQSILHMCFKKI